MFCVQQVMKFAELTQEVQIARPQEVRFDLGLTPGRRAVNQTYKLARGRGQGEVGGTKAGPTPVMLFLRCFLFFKFCDAVGALWTILDYSLLAHGNELSRYASIDYWLQ